MCGQAVPYSRRHTLPVSGISAPLATNAWISWNGLPLSIWVLTAIYSQYYLATIKPKLIYSSSIYGSAAFMAPHRGHKIFPNYLPTCRVASSSCPPTEGRFCASTTTALSHTFATLYANSDVDHHTRLLPGYIKKSLLMRALQAFTILGLLPLPPQPIGAHTLPSHPGWISPCLPYTFLALPLSSILWVHWQLHRSGRLTGHCTTATSSLHRWLPLSITILHGGSHLLIAYLHLQDMEAPTRNSYIRVLCPPSGHHTSSHQSHQDHDCDL